MFVTPATELLISCRMREFHNIKTYKKTRTASFQGHYKQLGNMDKKADAWTKFQNESKNKRGD